MEKLELSEEMKNFIKNDKEVTDLLFGYKEYLRKLSRRLQTLIFKSLVLNQLKCFKNPLKLFQLIKNPYTDLISDSEYREMKKEINLERKNLLFLRLAGKKDDGIFYEIFQIIEQI